MFFTGGGAGRSWTIAAVQFSLTTCTLEVTGAAINRHNHLCIENKEEIYGHNCLTYGDTCTENFTSPKVVLCGHNHLSFVSHIHFLWIQSFPEY